MTTPTAQSKLRFDPNSPEIKAYREALSRQFVREGTMVAFPMCLPGMTTQIPHDESRITALEINSVGHVYGGTSGHEAHLFGAAYHGLTGIVLDAGTVAGATSTVAICCGAGETAGAIAFLGDNGPSLGTTSPDHDKLVAWLKESVLKSRRVPRNNPPSSRMALWYHSPARRAQARRTLPRGALLLGVLLRSRSSSSSPTQRPPGDSLNCSTCTATPGKVRWNSAPPSPITVCEH